MLPLYPPESAWGEERDVLLTSANASSRSVLHCRLLLWPRVSHVHHRQERPLTDTRARCTLPGNTARFAAEQKIDQLLLLGLRVKDNSTRKFFFIIAKMIINGCSCGESVTITNVRVGIFLHIYMHIYAAR